jgi:multicomponent Na+:H+ antiporter subunit E
VKRLPLARTAALGVWFVLLWLMLWADVSAANLISGAILAIGVILATRRSAVEVDDGTVRIAPLSLVRFVGHVLVQLVRSNLALAWEIVTPTNTIAIGTVEVPLRSRSPIVMMAVSNVVTLTPGTVTVDAADEPPRLTVGVLHLHDPDEVRASIRRTEQLAIRAFGTVEARRSLDESGRSS